MFGHATSQTRRCAEGQGARGCAEWQGLPVHALRQEQYEQLTGHG